MRPLNHSLLAITSVTTLLSLVPAQSWQRDLDTAIERASSNNCPMVVAVVMPGERGSDAVIAHYDDPRIKKLLAKCSSLRIDVGDITRKSPDEARVLDLYLGAKPRDPVVVPHHVIVGTDGTTILSSAAYQMTAGQLEWFVVDGIRKVEPGFEWDFSDGARAPDGLSYDEVQKTEQKLTPPPTKDEVKAAIEQLKKGGRGWRDSIEAYTTLLRSSDKAAIKYVEGQLRGRQSFLASMALETIGSISPVAWSGVLSDFLDDRKASQRQAAARGLADMAHDKAGKAIRKALKSEKEPEVRAWLLRAAAASTPKDAAVVKAIDKALDKEPVEVRTHAAIAACSLEDLDAVQRLLTKALEDKDPMVRSAAALAFASRRDEQQLPLLREAVAAERNDEAKHWLELAVKTIADKGDLKGFKNFRTEVLGERRSTGNQGRNAGRRGGGVGGGAPGGGGLR